MKKSRSIARLGRQFDRELGYAPTLRTEIVRKIFPDHWTFLFGEIALYSFVILVVTGAFLCLLFRPGSETVIYHGPYAPLDGVPMSQAYRSMLTISFEVRAGLLIRQIHHWAANLFVAAIVVHIMRLFFTGAFRVPRRTNWWIGLTLLILAMTNGFTGYSVGDDLLSGAGLRIAYAVALSVPVIGPWLAFLFFGGPPPNPTLIPRIYAIHIFVVPAIMAALLTLHLGILWRQKHTNYPGPQRSDATIVGSRLWPNYAVKSIAMFLFVAAVLTALGAFAEINPVWIYGPYFGPSVSAGSQPDWYVGWLEGSLRLLPGLDIHIFGALIPQVFYAGVLFPLFVFGGLYLWPSIGVRLLHDKALHHVLYLPREHPWLTVLGMAVLALLFDMLLGGGNDVIAVVFNSRVSMLRNLFRGLLLGLPLAVGALTYAWLRIRRAKRGGGSG